MTKTKIYSFPEADLSEKYGEEILDYVEGCLIDNYITVNDDGKYFIYQEYATTTWISGYLMYEFNNGKEAWDFWDTYINIYDDEE